MSIKKGTYDPDTGAVGKEEVGEPRDVEVETPADRRAFASRDYVEKIIGVDPGLSVSEEEYKAYLENWEGEGGNLVSEQKEEERRAMIETGTIGLREKEEGMPKLDAWHPQYEVTEDSRIRGQSYGELLPEDQFPRNTRDW